MSEPITLAAWFVADEEKDVSEFPSTGKNSGSFAFQAVYWRCIVIFYALAKYTNPDWKLKFYTNVESLPVIDGVDVAAELASRAVVVDRLPITYRMPRGSVAQWGNQFYILDIIKYEAGLNDNYSLVVVDSDCVFTRPAPELAQKIAANGVVTLDVGYPEDHNINGMTRKQMLPFLREFTAAYPQYSYAGAGDSLAYLGGEFFCASASELRKISGQIDDLWKFTTDNAWKDGGIREEAHFLSTLYALNGYGVGTADEIIKRMWTSINYNNTTEADLNLPIWHLPGEKKLGYPRLFKAIFHDGLLERRLSNAEYVRTLATYFGVPKRTPLKVVRDLQVKALERGETMWKRWLARA